MKRVVTMHVIKVLPSHLSRCVLHGGICLAIVCGVEKDRTHPVVFKSSDSAHDFIGRLFKLVFAFVVAAVVIHAYVPSAYQYFMPIRLFERTWLKLTGIVLLFVSLAWTILAQCQMGDSWRIGIDAEHKTELVQSGVFRLFRNPIFFGMIVTLLALFLVIPNVVTLVTFLTGTF